MRLASAELWLFSPGLKLLAVPPSTLHPLQAMDRSRAVGWATPGRLIYLSSDRSAAPATGTCQDVSPGGEVLLARESPCWMAPYRPGMLWVPWEFQSSCKSVCQSFNPWTSLLGHSLAQTCRVHVAFWWYRDSDIMSYSPPLWRDT